MTLCSNNTPSTNEYTGNGAITEYSITFQYYSQSDIFVAFYDTAAEAWVSVSNSNWSFLNPTVIKFNTAPADNQRILIYRCTDIDPLPAEFFPGNSIKAADLNNNFFVMKSAIEEINTQAGSSDTLAQSAKATADAANTKADTAISTANTADTNATAAVNTANTALSTANTAVSTANAATTTANTADTKADTAITTANSASTTAGTALTNSQTAISTANTAATDASAAQMTAIGADNKADTAISTANTASTNASSAVTTANTADTNATTALNAANSATSTANTALSTANTAITTANTANTAATAASSDASAAVSSANAAVTTANTADTNATTALNTANSVAGVANTANTNATNAVNTANTALSTANTANTTANNANTTANNALSQVSAASPWSENNSVVSLVNNGSNVRVGTSSATAKLTVSSSATGNVLLGDFFAPTAGASPLIRMIGRNAANTGTTSVDFFKQYGSGFGIHNNDTDSSNFTRFIVGASERMRITSNGSVGIGSSNPARPLHVNSTLNNPVRIQSSAGYSRIEFQASGTTNPSNVSIGASNNDFRIFAGTNGGATRMIVTAGGTVGIAEENPESPLHISSSLNWNYPNLFLQRDASNISNHNKMIAFGLQADTASQANPANAAYIGLKTTTAPTTGDTVVSQSAKLEISSPGGIFFPTNVGIGNPNPGDYDSTSNDLVVGQAGQGDRGITIASGTSHRGTVMFADATSGLGEYAGYLQYNHNGDYLAIATNNSEALRITSNGNLGIGVSNPSEKLVLANVAAPTGFSDTAISMIRSNYGGRIAGYIHQGVGHGITFDTINAATPTERMRITQDGNLGIGESNPGHKLVVRGNAFFGPKNTTDQYQGLSLQNGKDSSTGVATHFVDFRNNLGIPDTHIFADHNTDGSSTIIVGTTVAGARNTDRRQESLRITGNGMVGIGRSAIDHRLDVEGSIRVSQGSAGLGFIQFGDDANSFDNYHIGSNSVGGFEIFNRNIGQGISRFSINSNGQVSIPGKLAIGAPPNSAGLLVRGADQNAPAAIYDNGSRGGFIKAFGLGSTPFAGGGVLFGAEQSYNAGSLGFAAIKGLLTDGGGNTRGDLSFYTRSSGSSTELTQRMRIDHTGTVHVSGNLNVSGTINGTPGSGGGGGGGGAYKNVKTDFGAVGNGTADDTAAVQTALNSGGTIYFPEGTYRITSTLTHTSAFNVVGDGQQSRIMFDAGVNDQNLFNLETNVRHNNDKKWSFSSIALSCKAVPNRIHASGIRIAYTGAATVIGGTNYLELNDVHIVSEITTDATQAYFKYGVATVNIGGIVADNLNISSFNVNCENDTDTVGIYIINNLPGHAVIRAFTGNNIYIQRYFKGLHATKAGGGQNIESIYMTQGEIVCNKGIDLAASHATFINGMHIECQRESYINTSDGGPHRVVGCDLRGGRNGTQNFTDYLIKIGVDNCSFTGNYITAQMPSAGCIKTGGSIGNPDNVSIVGNIFNGNGSSTYRALSCESGSVNVIFTGNLGSGFGGNSNPVFNQIGTGQGKLNNTTNEFQ